MKKVYRKPVIEIMSVESSQLMESSGKATVVWSKENSEIEVETGIPDQYTSIWGDEAEED